ncbi:ABC transporter permease [Chitinophaga ginsengisoli]|uniref:ABC-type antimicrobial peptide transport system permease subunit n=1 Tax=Chitinophaga ginsengisoli TaxID=363837 RepID=A0A2P8FS11_9BACT|nr:ABC transporter permease [Chitinophaga ginsengisoli]PSL24499.1 ABC-type antimicrobial peptide transport system permease subunit [Chitinophaga ginsengisoli]
MIRNHLKIAWRSLLSTKRFSIINISGLAVGMAAAGLVFLWLQNEISFDKFHENKDRLYEVRGLTAVDGTKIVINQTEQPLGPALKKDFGEIESAARLADVSSLLLTAGDKRFTGINGGFVDPAFLRMFSFPVVGTTSTAPLKQINSIVITEGLAEKLFGKEDALNKVIKIDSVDYFQVTAVLKHLPSNTRFDFEYLLPWDYLRKIGWNNDSWLSNNISTFVLLKPNTNVTTFNDKIAGIARRYSGNPEVWTHFLFPLEQWHLYAEFKDGKPSGGRITVVRLFTVVVILILLIACINFINLSTAKSEKRAKEVGVRKVAGAGKGMLISQFMTEALLMSFIAGTIALAIVHQALPYFNGLVNVPLSIPYGSTGFWVSALGFILITGVLAGSYPAFYLSAFKPVSVLKGGFRGREGRLSPRKVLVIFQFTFAVILIISTIVIRNQIRYAQERETGYSRSNLINVNFEGDIAKNYDLIRHDLISEGIAASVTKTMSAITERGSNTWGLEWEGKPTNFEGTIALFSADANLVKTVGLQLKEGRDIDIHRYPTDSFAVLLNETAVKVMGFKDPIGQLIRQSGNVNWKVVGVVKDYVIGSSYGTVPPVVIEGPASWFNTLHIRFNTSGSVAEYLKKAEVIFNRYNPGYPFNYQFTDQQYAKLFDAEQRTQALAGLSAALAIFISCLGLLGLSAYVAERRVKEIGVRKALGASVLNITGLLTFDFMKLVVAAIVVAIPIGWLAMNAWLEHFEYKVAINGFVFVFAALLVISITLLTVSYEVIRAAMVNPVKSLKRE